jgi:hypothetical protein
MLEEWKGKKWTLGDREIGFTRSHHHLAHGEQRKEPGVVFLEV